MSERLQRILLALLLVAGIAGIYSEVGSFDFVNYDDDRYVTSNPNVQAGLTGDSIAWAFTTRHASNWHPVTWLSHMLDAELFELEPAGHHRSSVLWHAVAALALFAALVRMTDRTWASFFAAALFAWSAIGFLAVNAGYRDVFLQWLPGGTTIDQIRAVNL